MLRLFPPKDLQRAGLVSRAYAIDEVVLASLSVTRHCRLEDLPKSGPLRLDFSDSARGVLAEDGKRIVLHLKFELAAMLPGEKEERALTIKSEYELSYQRVAEVELADSDVRNFAKVNAIYNAWPYLRELVSNVVARIGYPPLTMGPLVVAPEADQPKKSAASR